ncbi:hypothetical protein CFRS1_v009317 [Colletotrichum fructicola]|nr:hypothetical protein CFRS1_v009317 [Colletotrichum fructicola]
MKFTLAFVLTLVAAASAASVDVGLVQRQDNCASKGANCGGPGDRGCCSGTTCKTGQSSTHICWKFGS